MTDEVKGTMLNILRDYGFATLLACALLYVGRQDLLLPMVEAHKEFLREVADTQKEISMAIQEQTRLLYALQPRTGERVYTSSVVTPDTEPKN